MDTTDKNISKNIDEKLQLAVLLSLKDEYGHKTLTNVIQNLEAKIKCHQG